MDSVKKSRLRLLSFVFGKILLKSWYKWKTTVKFLQQPRIPDQTYRINQNYTDKNSSSTPTKTPNRVFCGLSGSKNLNIATQKTAEKNLKRISSSTVSIFEEIKASLKSKAANSRLNPSPNKELTDSPTETFGVALRTRHKRANTDCSSLKSSICTEKN